MPLSNNDHFTFAAVTNIPPTIAITVSPCAATLALIIYCDICLFPVLKL